jgi:hypothetical protein
MSSPRIRRYRSAGADFLGVTSAQPRAIKQAVTVLTTTTSNSRRRIPVADHVTGAG